MYVSEYLAIVIFLCLFAALAVPLGNEIYRVIQPNEKPLLASVFQRVEKWIYRIAGINPLEEQNWKAYLLSIIVFSCVCLVITFCLLSLQQSLPLNPQKYKALSWHLNLNTSISYVTNTNWQSYGGESTLSYFSQMAALIVQNFVSPAVGMACLSAFTRGLIRQSAETIGNFWTDLVRIILYVLVPISVIGAVLFVSQGVPQNFHRYVHATTLEGKEQVIAQGPVASGESIKLLGTNGGGFMRTNSAHPYENPTPFTNLLQMVLIFLLPTAQIYAFGRAIGDTKHAWYIFTTLSILFVVGMIICLYCESVGDPQWRHLWLTGGNWEGKEIRFGLFDSVLYACVTTASSCGAVNCMHDSFTPIGGLIPMCNMQLSEVIFGGAGSGLCGVILFVILSIFIAGLILGRSPEYLGKKIEPYDMKMTVLATLSYISIVHLFTALAVFGSWGINGLGNSGPHGFSEILYAFSSCTANNGSAFAGLMTNTAPYNITLSLAMLLGRFCVIAPVIGLAGSFAKKQALVTSAASFPVSSFIFIFLFIGIIGLFCALTFLPAWAMGPIIELFAMLRGTFFS